MADEGDKSGTSVAAALAAARRITVKVGSSLIVGKDDGVRDEWLASIGADIAALHGQGKQVVLVSSGAVALGRTHLRLRKSGRLDHKQAAAAAGQALLMQAWERALAPHGIPTAQLLLTIDDTEQRRRSLNARATLEVLLAAGGLPVINENDSVATDELRYGDNDRLSARTAQLVKSDVLVLLSDVDGLYTADPSRNPGAAHIAFVPAITAEIEAHAGGAGSAGVGTGGMRTKLEAARIASGFGCATIIACGRDPHPLARLAEGARSTLIAPSGSPASAYKAWIKAMLAPGGAVTIDDGAVRALIAGKSLLPAGVTLVEGDFDRGACVRVLDRAGSEVARGIAAYSAAEASLIRGRGSADIAAALGYSRSDELIHRDDLVML
ncbi:MAG: glutamate 5-kinase [Sphingomicrobium sp.]